jgi:hypothetical protein
MAKYLHAWQTWWSFTPMERSLWLQAWLVLPLVVLGLQLFGLRQVQALLDRFSGKRADRLDLPEAQASARIFYSAVHRGFLPGRCLEQSLAFGWLLHRQGLAAELRIGVAKPAGQFAAHAWVEHGGVALEENGLYPEFVAFDRAVMPLEGQEA